MKQLILKVILPLTIISFGLFTKWWYTLPVDAPDTMLSGFPLPYVGDGWHTSMSLQFFIFEFTIDLLTYFLICYMVVCLANQYLIKTRPGKIITRTLWSIAGIFILIAGLVLNDSNHLYYVKRPFEMEIMETGYKFIWQQVEQPDFYKYHPERKQ